MTKAEWIDAKNFLGKLTLKKATNALAILFSFIFSRIFKANRIIGLPVSISVEPTTSCNLRCPECPSGLRSFTRPTGMLQNRTFTKIMDEIGDRLVNLTFYFQGEPYLNPEFLDMVAQASNKNIYTSTSTNAHYLTPDNAEKTVKSGLDRLIVSIDGTTQEIYEQYRVGGQLEKVLAGTRNIIKAKKELGSHKPFVTFQYLVVRPNEHQIEDAKQMAKDLGVDAISFKTAQIYDFENGNDLIPTIDKYSRYEKISDDKYKFKNKLIDHCWKMWHSCVITWDGTVVPCCFDKDAHHALGSLQKSTFKQIWQSAAYLTFRKQLIKSRKSIEICQNCTEGTEIWG